MWTRTYQSPAIEKSIVAEYRPGSVSFASAKTGVMPACDMFPSSRTRTPAGGFAEASDSFSMIVN